ncbi:hypothetical protein NLM31_37735 [Bradyrhizobium sp. CCGUVB4N]|uniref:hypothetical protein n=1 Tax=Bradyrhizobium sp. CCGUVB4N TaxID=2949631 RepID=UPI0020B4152E|nr:hypothetical protein [Bradyrhizobium sp. CCGUVB4N]MCP3386138.1 hypothetical protein [Bradyrhizobium sp. CCGUVB4N]
MRGFIMEQDHEIAEKSGRPALEIKRIERVGAKKKRAAAPAPSLRARRTHPEVRGRVPKFAMSCLGRSGATSPVKSIAGLGPLRTCRPTVAVLAKVAHASIFADMLQGS